MDVPNEEETGCEPILPPSVYTSLPPSTPSSSGPALTIPLQNHPRHLGSGPRASLDRDPVPKGGFHLSCPCCHLPGITGFHGRVASYGLDGKGTTPGSPQALFQGLFVFLNSFPASPCPSYSYSCSQKNVREGPSSPETASVRAVKRSVFPLPSVFPKSRERRLWPWCHGGFWHLFREPLTVCSSRWSVPHTHLLCDTDMHMHKHTNTCMQAHTHTCTHTYAPTYMHTHACTYMHTHLRMHIHAHTHTCAHTYASTHTYTQTHTHARIHAHTPPQPSPSLLTSQNNRKRDLRSRWLA